MADKKPKGPLLQVKEENQLSGTKKTQHVYSGKVGNVPIGNVVAENKTKARKKLLTIARKLLK